MFNWTKLTNFFNNSIINSNGCLIIVGVLDARSLVGHLQLGVWAIILVVVGADWLLFFSVLADSQFLVVFVLFCFALKFECMNFVSFLFQ